MKIVILLMSIVSFTLLHGMESNDSKPVPWDTLPLDLQKEVTKESDILVPFKHFLYFSFCLEHTYADKNYETLINKELATLSEGVSFKELSLIRGIELAMMETRSFFLLQKKEDLLKDFPEIVKRLKIKKYIGKEFFLYKALREMDDPPSLHPFDYTAIDVQHLKIGACLPISTHIIDLFLQILGKILDPNQHAGTRAFVVMKKYRLKIRSSFQSYFTSFIFPHYKVSP